ncbi:MAG: cyclic-phosphate processing receiver domain-containing protein [Candidatus Ranarchaeia archaeon]|jgi:hypothetical protein
MDFKEFFEAEAAGGIELWLDDDRDPELPQYQGAFGAKPGMLWVKTAWDAVKVLKQGNVKFISFDNDIGFAPTQYDDGIKVENEGKYVAKWIEIQAFWRKEGMAPGIPPLKWAVHTKNVEGEKEIRMAMAKAEEFWGESG